MRKEVIAVLLLCAALLTAAEPKSFTPFDANVTPHVQIVNRVEKPTAENSYLYNHYYYETDRVGEAVFVFGLGHLFNFDRVVDEYKSYFRSDPPRSDKYMYRFDYADEIENK